MNKITLSQSLKKSYLKAHLNHENFNHFTKQFEQLKQDIHLEESEEHNKQPIAHFLQNTFYQNYQVNTLGKVDLSIMDDRLQVIIETKSPKNSKEIHKNGDFNQKALHEAILYYLREDSASLKYVILTNAIEWYFIDARDFHRLATHKEIAKLYDEVEIKKSLPDTTTQYFYKTIKTIISTNNLLDNIKYTSFDINNPKEDLRHIYRILSPQHLLKQFISDANSLNKKFYYELLYILGLEEIKMQGKKLIRRAKAKIEGSFIENTILKLQTEFKIDDEEECFEIALELNITWLNRILFLKLLEARLSKIHHNASEDKSMRFLNYDIIAEFDILNTLFFEVLAKKIEDRKAVHIKAFANIPYLNSSLFETTTTEKKYLRISNLKNDLFLPLYSSTILEDKQPLKSLEYLLYFLNSYDFGSDEHEAFKSEHRPIINSAVLGLIFEKINGYKEGSFFTPAFITSFMSKTVLEKRIIDLFNEKLGYSCLTMVDIYNQNLDLKKANELINSITICDPSVGSGHFLVSMLNEILAIKSSLGILCDENGKRIKIEVYIEDDEIYLQDENGEIFEYTVNEKRNTSSEKYRIQETLFNEKKQIIENQLFGVDINSNSANIARLRLWIELLKESYYKNGELTTLPNIDINIKCANSLLSRFDIYSEVKNNNIQHEINHYKTLIKDYQTTRSKFDKEKIYNSIAIIKQQFQNFLKASWRETSKLEQLLQKYTMEFGLEQLDSELILLAIEKKLQYNKGTQKRLLENDTNQKQAQDKEQQKLLQAIHSVKDEIQELESGEIYRHAFEWRFEFPEALNERGNFMGFDIVIGNPPYIMEDGNKNAFKGLHKSPYYQGKMDLWHLFTCVGIDLVKRSGLISFIAKNQWLGSSSSSKMRKKMYTDTQILSIVDFDTNMVFDEASQQTMIFLLSKNTSSKQHSISYKKIAPKLSIKEIQTTLKSNDHNTILIEKILPKDFDENENLTFATSQNEKLLDKIASKKNFVFDEKQEITQGIIGGPDKAFIVQDNELKQFTKQEQSYLKMLHTHTERYCTPNSNQYMFYLDKSCFSNRQFNASPNIQKKLNYWREELSNRREVLNKKLSWFNLWWARNESFFQEGDKLIWAKRTEGRKFTFTHESFYGTANLFFIRSKRIDLKYLTALLNSRLMYFYMQYRLKHTGDLLQIDKNQFMKIPILNIAETQPFTQVVDEILQTKDKGTESEMLEQKMDKMVYKLYGLSKKEIQTIEDLANI